MACLVMFIPAFWCVNIASFLLLACFEDCNDCYPSEGRSNQENYIRGDRGDKFGIGWVWIVRSASKSTWTKKSETISKCFNIMKFPKGFGEIEAFPRLEIFSLAWFRLYKLEELPLVNGETLPFFKYCQL